MANRRRKRRSDETKQAANHSNNVDDTAASQSSSEKRKKTAPTSDSPSDTAAATAKQPLFPKLPSLSRVMSIVMLMIGIIAVGALFYKVMAGFFVPLFLATLLVVIFRPVHLWIYERTGGRPRVAAATTTFLISLVVLLPVIMILSVAISQFTAIVGHAKNFTDLSDALDRARERLSLDLPHSAQFRRLDVLANSFDTPDDPPQVLAHIDEAVTLLRYLQEEVPGPPAAESDATAAEDKLAKFATVVRQHDAQGQAEEMISELNAKEQFHRQSVVASAAIRKWMQTLLGGTFRSQARLLANPSEADFAELLKTGRQTLQPRFVAVTSATGMYLFGGLVSLLILVVAVYFFLLDGPAMIRTLMRLSPMDDNYERRLLIEFDRTSRAVVLASVLSALVQGMLSAIAFWLMGFHSVILLFLLTTIMALIPFLGAASVWVPCACWLAAVEERWTAAIILAIYGMTIVSSIDNVIKMYVLHGRSTLHPLFALLAVFGGVKVFGPIGVLVGPMVVVFLQTLLEILNHELISTETDESQMIKAKEISQMEPAD